MKVLHVPYCYYPDAVGGTEVYVASLARAQKTRGLELAIAAPGDLNQSYSHDGIDVHRFATGKDLDIRAIYGGGDPEAARNFLKILECVRPDIVHLHAFTSGVSVRVAQVIREHRIPIVFTYHTPTVTCTRGTMMLWGREACDGEMRVGRCARCRLQSKGMPMAASFALGHMPVKLGSLAGSAGLSGGFWTAFRATELVALRHSASRKFLLSQTNHIIAVCEWVRKALIANGVTAEKITLSRQGVPYPIEFAAAAPETNRPVRFAFLGRLDAVKGIDVLIDAFQEAPQLNATLDVFAVIQDEPGRTAHAQLLGKIEGDARIRFQAPVRAAKVISLLRSYDALLVPSQWLETGPLVVYEAFAAGIPVIGSALGGIAELVSDGENGLLVTPSSVTSWSATIRRLVDEPGLLGKLKAAPKPVRTVDDAAADAATVYAKVLGRRA